MPGLTFANIGSYFSTPSVAPKNANYTGDPFTAEGAYLENVDIVVKLPEPQPDKKPFPWLIVIAGAALVALVIYYIKFKK